MRLITVTFSRVSLLKNINPNDCVRKCSWDAIGKTQRYNIACLIKEQFKAVKLYTTQTLEDAQFEMSHYGILREESV